MPHLKTAEAQKKFINKKLKEASKKEIERIYKYTEYVIGYYKKKDSKSKK